METVLFDGHCNLCRASVERLRRWVSPTRVRFESFRDPGVLARHPQVSAERCERALQWVDARGRVREGAAAIAFLLRWRTLGLSLLYFLPGLRQGVDLAYAWVARRRFELAGRSEGCVGGTCAIRYQRPAKGD